MIFLFFFFFGILPSFYFVLADDVSMYSDERTNDTPPSSAGNEAAERGGLAP